MTTCADCFKKLTRYDDTIDCVVEECKKLYHIDCCGISMDKFTQMKQSGEVKNWKCNLCRKVTMEDLYKLMNNMRKEMFEYRKSVDFCNDKMDDAMEMMKKMTQEAVTQKKEVEELKAENKVLKNQIVEIQLKTEEMHQHDLNRNLIFDGLPMMKDENLMEDFIPRISKAVNIAINKSDVQAVHRLPSAGKGRENPIIVEFTNRRVRDQVLTNGRKKRIKTNQLYPALPEQPLYVTEHLTKHNRNLLYLTKQAKKANNFAFVWFSNNKILLKITEKSRPIIIRKEKDLQEIVEQNKKKERNEEKEK